jgi:hypothetical protein
MGVWGRGRAAFILHIKRDSLGSRPAYARSVALPYSIAMASVQRSLANDWMALLRQVFMLVFNTAFIGGYQSQ